MTGIASVAAIKHQRRRSPASDVIPILQAVTDTDPGLWHAKPIHDLSPRREALHRTGVLILWHGSAVCADDVTSPEVGGGRRGLATAPGERAVLEHHREGAHLIIVERGAVLDLQVQVRRERAARVADGGDPLTLGDGLARTYQRAALLEVHEHHVVPSADVEDDRVAFGGRLERADRLVSEVVADAQDGAVGRC